MKHRSKLTRLKKRIFQIIIPPHFAPLREPIRAQDKNPEPGTESETRENALRLLNFLSVAPIETMQAETSKTMQATAVSNWCEQHVTALLLDWFFVEKVPSHLCFFSAFS